MQALSGVMEKGKMKILFVPAATRVVAATRYRIYEYLPYLEKAGVSYRIYPLNSERISRLSFQSSAFSPWKRWGYYFQVIAERFLRSFAVLCLAARYDIVFIQRATFLLGMERLLQRINKNIIFDFDDAIFVADKGKNSLVDRLREKVQYSSVSGVIRISKCVIVENDYVRDYALQYCSNVQIITGPIDTERNIPGARPQDSKEVVIGWIGSPSTAPYLGVVEEALKTISKKYPVAVKLIGAGRFVLPQVNLVLKDWSIDSELQELQSLDIGIMPMPDNEWTRGKVSIKLLQYMAAGIPAVCSPVGEHRRIIQDGVNGFLAASPDEWARKLSVLIEDAQLRQKVGSAGRRTAEERFSVKVNAPKMFNIFKQVYLNGKL